MEYKENRISKTKTKEGKTESTCKRSTTQKKIQKKTRSVKSNAGIMNISHWVTRETISHKLIILYIKNIDEKKNHLLQLDMQFFIVSKAEIQKARQPL